MKFLDKRFDFIETEKIFLKKWKKNKTFQFLNKKTTGSKFSIMMPPPNITGSLHMGHALTFTLQDILIRFNKKLGKHVLWQSGIDHAGIATELIVEKKLIKEEKKSKKKIGRDAFLDKIWSWKNESGNKIIDQLERLGAAVDWKISKFTMDNQLSDAVNEVFIKLYEEGLIYKDKRLINWDPEIQSAVSDLEVTQKEVIGNLWFIKYKIANSNSNIVVATTTQILQYCHYFVPKSIISQVKPNGKIFTVLKQNNDNIGEFVSGIKIDSKVSFSNLFNTNVKLLKDFIIEEKDYEVNY